MKCDMPVATHVIWREIQNMKVTIENIPYFKTFYDRKEIHVSNNNSHKLLHENLPRHTMNEITNAHYDNFKQCENDCSFMHMVASNPRFATIFAQHVLNIPTHRGTEKHLSFRVLLTFHHCILF